jgi:hypothetical protein
MIKTKITKEKIPARDLDHDPSPDQDPVTDQEVTD